MRSTSWSGIAVGPPLMWETTSGLVLMTSSAVTVELPGMEVPPVCIWTLNPYLWAHSTIGEASSGLLTDPRPISPTIQTPSLDKSSKSFSTRPFSRIRAPPSTFTLLGWAFSKLLWPTIARALVPEGSLGRPGVWHSPAEIMVVTPPFLALSI